MKKNVFRMLPLVAFVLLAVWACGPMTSTVVVLNREEYTPKVSPAEFSELQGRQILIWSIVDQAKNTENLAYYNEERTVGYKLFYSNPDRSMSQPVVSFLWYSLKKGFEQAGIKVVEDGPLYDAELFLTILSLTDEEIHFTALVTRSGRQLYTKEYRVHAPGAKSTDREVLKQRAYGMLDEIVRTILRDDDFRKGLSSKV